MKPVMRALAVPVIRPLLVGCLSVFLLAAMPPGRFYRVKDIKAVPGSGPDPPVSAIVAGNTLFFTASNALWVSDGTAAGTQPHPGTSGITGIGFGAVLDDVLYFTASEGSHGSELWRSDGTRDGTWMVRDINPGLAGSGIRSLVPFRGELYFGANDGVHGYELWKTDGTEDGTVLVADLNPGPDGSALFSLRASGDRLYFSESSFVPGSPGLLYTTDGTASGTRLLRQFVLASAGCYLEGCVGWPPGGFVSLGGLTYFIASDETSGLELWRTDGTTPGTTLVRDICPTWSAFSISDDPESPLLHVMNDRLVFFADDGVHGSELWTSDGTEAGTRLVKDIFPGPLESSFGYGATVAGAELFFPAHSSQSDRRHERPAWELWRSDGTEAGTFMLGSGAGDSGDSFLGQITPVGDAVFFSAVFREPRSLGPGVRRLWRTDSAGTPASIVSDAFSDPTGLVKFRGTLYFAASGPEGLSLWKSDGTPGGTSVVRSLSRRENSSSSVLPLGELDGSLLFFATDGRESRRLWRSDGTESRTEPVAPVAFGDTLGLTRGSTPFQGSLFFNGNDGVHGSELWRTDGTPEGTWLVKDIAVIGGIVYPGIQDSSPCGFNAIGDTLYFSAFDGDHATKGLWKTDGTEAGTVFLKEVSLICSWQPELVPLNGLLYFSGLAPVYESGLWRTDGTGPGTEPVRPVSVGDLISLGDRLLFWGWTASEGGALWTSDGTAAGTAIVKAVSGYLPFARLKDGVLFFGTAGESRMQLWRTDGTSGGTTVLADFPLGFVGDGLNGLVTVGGRVFFAGQDAGHGIELWTSDGTPSGTHIVRDIAPGEASSYPRNLTAVGDVLLFSARDPIHGEELWRSDGTEEGTFLLDDIFPGSGSSSPANFIKAGSLIYFTADDGETGVELWAMPLSALDLAPGRTPRQSHGVPWRH